MGKIIETLEQPEITHPFDQHAVKNQIFFNAQALAVTGRRLAEHFYLTLQYHQGLGRTISSQMLHGMALQTQPQVKDIVEFCGIQLTHEEAATWLGDQQSTTLQQPCRLANRRPADAKIAG